jgi:hypothetical protein
MRRTQVTGSSRQEEQRRPERSLSKATTVALFIWFTIVSFLFTGYGHIYGMNHPYQLVLVQKLNDTTLYPNDPFVDASYYGYASVFWYVVAWLSRVVDLSWVLFVFFLVNKLLFLYAGFRLGRTFFPNSKYAPVVGLIVLSTFPHSLFGNGYPTGDTQQTSLCVGVLLLALDAFLNRKWVMFAIWFGFAINLNLMFSVYGLTYLAFSWLMQLRKDSSEGYTWKPLVALVAGIVVGTPGIYLVLRASTHAEHNPLSVWQACELSYPYHFFPQTWEVLKQLLALVLAIAVIFVVYRFRNASPVGIHAVAWTLVATGWYLLGWINPLLIHSLPPLHLHPVRALVLWQLATMVFLTSFIMHRIESQAVDKHILNDYIFYAIFAVIFINEFSISKWFIGFAVLSVIFCESARRLLILQRIVGSGPALAVASVAFFVSLSPALISLRATIRGQDILSVIPFPALQAAQSPASVIADWARQNTPKDSIFLVPIYQVNAWSYFRHLSQRSVFTHHKDGAAWSYAPWFADEWLTRMKVCGVHDVLGLDEKSYTIGSWLRIWRRAEGISSPTFDWIYVEENLHRAYSNIDDNKVETLRRQYKIDYWITKRNVKTKFPIVYEYGEYKVLKISN